MDIGLWVQLLGHEQTAGVDRMGAGRSQRCHKRCREQSSKVGSTVVSPAAVDGEEGEIFLARLFSMDPAGKRVGGGHGVWGGVGVKGLGGGTEWGKGRLGWGVGGRAGLGCGWGWMGIWRSGLGWGVG